MEASVLAIQLSAPPAAGNRAKADGSGTWRRPFALYAHANEIAGDADIVEAILVGRFGSSYVLVVVMLVTQLFRGTIWLPHSELARDDYAPEPGANVREFGANNARPQYEPAVLGP